MLCQKCHKNLATVRYAEVVDGTVNDLHLCQECLERHQSDAETGFELAEPAPFRGKRRKMSALHDAAKSTLRCDACGTDLAQVLETGKVGCASCYTNFAAQLESLLEGMHAGLLHRGKVPNVDDERARVRADLQNKRALLKTALTMENYEEAAALRDEIRSLVGGLAPSRCEAP